MIKEATNDFMHEISQGTVLVMVTAPGCGPCNMMKRDILPDIEGIDIYIVDASHQMGQVGMVQEDSGSIQSVPVCVLYKDGEFAKRHNGPMSLDELQEFIED